MRAIRLTIAALIAVALAVLPMAAGLAKPPAAQAEMGMSDDGCPCCEMNQDLAADICVLKCSGAVAILVEGQPFIGPTIEDGVDMAGGALSPFLPPPDPPPPRD